MLTCVWRIRLIHREAIISPKSTAPLTHRPRNTVSLIKSQTAWQRRRERRRGGGEGKTPASRLLLAIKNSIVLWDESSAVTSLPWNLTAKNYLVRQLWVWQARAGGCRGTVDPLPIFPHVLPSSCSSSTRGIHIPSFSSSLISFSCHSLSQSSASFSLSSPMFLTVRSDKQAEGFVLINSGKSYLLPQYLGPKQRQNLDK